MTVKEANEAARQRLPVYFKGDNRFKPAVYARIAELGTVYDPPGYHIRVQDLRYPKAFHWKDIADCEVIRRCAECPMYNIENADCGHCPLEIFRWISEE